MVGYGFLARVIFTSVVPAFSTSLTSSVSEDWTNWHLVDFGNCVVIAWWQSDAWASCSIVGFTHIHVDMVSFFLSDITRNINNLRLYQLPGSIDTLRWEKTDKKCLTHRGHGCWNHKWLTNCCSFPNRKKKKSIVWFFHFVSTQYNQFHIHDELLLNTQIPKEDPLVSFGFSWNDLSPYNEIIKSC